MSKTPLCIGHFPGQLRQREDKGSGVNKTTPDPLSRPRPLIPSSTPYPVLDPLSRPRPLIPSSTPYPVLHPFSRPPLKRPPTPYPVPAPLFRPDPLSRPTPYPVLDPLSRPRPLIPSSELAPPASSLLGGSRAGYKGRRHPVSIGRS